MTNGEKIKVTFPHYDIEIEEHKGYVRVFYEDFYTTYPLRWWNAEYNEPTTKNDLEVDTNKLLADCEKMSFDIEIFNKPLKVVALDAVKNIAKDLINSENPNKSEILTGSTTKNDLGVDAISRQEVLYLIADDDLSMGQVVRGIHALPSVIPQEPKTGHWVKYGIPRCGEQHYKCTNCEEYFNFGLYSDYYKKAFKYCPNCGAKMVEPQESVLKR